MYHANYYQRDDWFLYGDSVPGAQKNVDKSAETGYLPWGPLAGPHGQIMALKSVRDAIVDDIRAKVVTT
jgi:hypothetical protein